MQLMDIKVGVTTTPQWIGAADAIGRMKERFRGGWKWRKGSYGNALDGWCLIGGALAETTGWATSYGPDRVRRTEAEESPAFQAVKAALKNATGGRREVEEWNDTEGRKWAEVDALLVTAQRLAKEKEAEIIGSIPVPEPEPESRPVPEPEPESKPVPVLTTA